MAEVMRLPRGSNWQKLAAPILVIMILAMMVLPLPPFLLNCYSPSTSRCR